MASFHRVTEVQLGHQMEGEEQGEVLEHKVLGRRGVLHSQGEGKHGVEEELGQDKRMSLMSLMAVLLKRVPLSPVMVYF